MNPTVQKVIFVPKQPVIENSKQNAWQVFGAPSESEWLFWLPEVCGICCVKMIGDTLGLTHDQTIYSLTQSCQKLGGYILENDKHIRGVFHVPLLQLARNLGMEGEVLGNLDIEVLQESLRTGYYVILSIDLTKISSEYTGSHLVLVHSMNMEQGKCTLHDPSCVIRQNGENIIIDFEELKKISNRRGLRLKKA